jgi:hypothetical protein
MCPRPVAQRLSLSPRCASFTSFSLLFLFSHSRRSSPPAKTSSGRHRLRFKGEDKKKSAAAPVEEKLDEIAEANALRAKLGLKPLRP